MINLSIMLCMYYFFPCFPQNNTFFGEFQYILYPFLEMGRGRFVNQMHWNVVFLHFHYNVYGRLIGLIKACPGKKARNNHLGATRFSSSVTLLSVNAWGNARHYSSALLTSWDQQLSVNCLCNNLNSVAMCTTRIIQINK